MFRLSAMTGCVLVLVALLVGTGQSGDTKKDPPKKVQIPAGWKKLGLSDDQRKKVLATRTMFAAKIEALRAQIDQAKKDEQVELIKILTEDQKEMLRKAAAAKVPPPETKKPADDKKKEPDKN